MSYLARGPLLYSNDACCCICLSSYTYIHVYSVYICYIKCLSMSYKDLSVNAFLIIYYYYFDYLYCNQEKYLHVEVIFHYNSKIIFDILKYICFINSHNVDLSMSVWRDIEMQ